MFAKESAVQLNWTALKMQRCFMVILWPRCYAGFELHDLLQDLSSVVLIYQSMAVLKG